MNACNYYMHHGKKEKKISCICGFLGTVTLVNRYIRCSGLSTWKYQFSYDH